MEERIMTLHPQGKQGVNISKQKYDAMSDAIVESLQVHGELTFQRLVDDVQQKLNGNFDGSITWYVTTIKLDLEARGILERTPNTSPQLLRLVES